MPFPEPAPPSYDAEALATLQMTGEIGSRVRVSTLTGTGYYEGRLGSVIRTPAGIDAVVLEVDDADHMPARVTVRWAAVEALSVLAPPDDEEGPS